MNCADIEMVHRGCGLGLTLKAGQGLRVASSSPGPFSCYKMQGRLNEKLQGGPNCLSHYRGSSESVRSNFGPIQEGDK
jgi:hypothetical protein